MDVKIIEVLVGFHLRRNLCYYYSINNSNNSTLLTGNIVLNLFQTSLRCNDSLRWMRIAETQGWLTLKWDLLGSIFVPNCRNKNVTWADVTFQGNISSKLSSIFSVFLTEDRKLQSAHYPWHNFM